MLPVSFLHLSIEDMDVVRLFEVDICCALESRAFVLKYQNRPFRRNCLFLVLNSRRGIELRENQSLPLLMSCRDSHDKQRRSKV